MSHSGQGFINDVSASLLDASHMLLCRLYTARNLGTLSP